MKYRAGSGHRLWYALILTERIAVRTRQMTVPAIARIRSSGWVDFVVDVSGCMEVYLHLAFQLARVTPNITSNISPDAAAIIIETV